MEFYVLLFLLGGVSALLSNQGLAFFHDSIRLEFAHKEKEKNLANYSMKLLLPMVIAIGIPFTMAYNLLSLWLVFTIGDLIGLQFKKNRWGLLFSFLLSGGLSVFISFTLFYANQQISQFLTIDFENQFQDVFRYFQQAYLLVPILMIGYQFGVKKSIYAFFILFLVYIIVYKYVPLWNPSITCTIVGFSLYISIVLLNMKINKSETMFAKNFSTNIETLEKKWYLFAIMGSLISVAIFINVVTPNLYSQALMSQSLVSEALLLTILFSLSILPSLLASTFVSGAYSPYGIGLSSIWGMILQYIFLKLGFESNPILYYGFLTLALIGGFFLHYFELRILSKLTNTMERHQEMKTMGIATRKALYYILDISLIVGSISVIETLFHDRIAGIGLVWCLGLYIINRNMKERFIESYAIGPFAIVSLTILFAIFSYLGF